MCLWIFSGFQQTLGKIKVQKTKQNKKSRLMPILVKHCKTEITGEISALHMNELNPAINSQWRYLIKPLDFPPHSVKDVLPH